jgi:hypothetical protein
LKFDLKLLKVCLVCNNTSHYTNKKYFNFFNFVYKKEITKNFILTKKVLYGSPSTSVATETRVAIAIGIDTATAVADISFFASFDSSRDK